MILNYDKKFLIFSPWKNASSTLHRRLENFNQSPYPRFYYFNENLKRIVHRHITIADFKSLPEYLLDLKKIAFIRNPYDRVYSGFLQIQKDIKARPKMVFPEAWIKNYVLQQLKVNEQKLVQANYDFNQWVSILEPEDIYQIGGNSSLPLHPTHYWTHDLGNQFVDFIGKVESFEEDFIKMLSYLQISDSYNLKNVNVIPNEGALAYKYIDKMSKHSINKINYLFEKDFQLFEYKLY